MFKTFNKISHLNSYILFGSVHSSRQSSNRHICRSGISFKHSYQRTYYLTKTKLPQGLLLSLLRGSLPKSVRASSKQYTWEFPKFHPNAFTSGGVIAERVNSVETRHKVFPILVISWFTAKWPLFS